MQTRFSAGAFVAHGVACRLLRGRRGEDGAPVLVRLGDRGESHGELLQRFARELRLSQQAAPWALRAVEIVDGVDGVGAIYEDSGLSPLSNQPAETAQDLSVFLRRARAAAVALDAMHSAGWVHRALSPASVLVSEDGQRAWLMGLSWSSVPGEPAPPCPPVETRVRWAAPEVLARGGAAPDQRSDLYSLGALLVEALTGRPLFAATGTADWIHAHLAHPPPDPSQLDPRVPPQVAAVLLCLLAKDPQARYPSAAALRDDLDRCLRSWEQGGEVPSFPLTLATVSLELPRHPIGREAQLRTLKRALDRAAEGHPGLVLITGPAGIGKTMIAEAFARSAAARGARVARGKCAQGALEQPYDVILQAFTALAWQWLTEPEEQLAPRRDRLREQLGGLAGVVAQLAPTLAPVLGPAELPPQLPDAEARNRSDLALVRLARAAGPEPTVLLLEDLHRADPPTLDVLHAMVTAPGDARLLVVATLRDQELELQHPALMASLQDTARRIHVDVLDVIATAHVIATALSLPATDVSHLAARVHARSGGNPLHIAQLLRALAAEGTLRHDRGAGRWVWDVAAVDRAGAAPGVGTEVLELLHQRIARLPAATQRALRWAAVLGSPIDDALLAGCLGEPVQAVRDALLPATAAGLVCEAPPADPRSPAARLVFTHDRVQEVAAATLDEAEVATIHVRATRTLLARQQASDAPSPPFDLVRHAAHAAASLHCATERLAVARLVLNVAQRTLQAGAPHQAAHAAQVCLSLLPDDAWTRDPALAQDAHVAAARAEYLASNRDRADALVEIVRLHTVDPVALAQVSAVRIQIFLNDVRVEEAAAEGIRELGILGVELPPDGDVSRLLAAVEAARAGRDVQALRELPAATDPRDIAVFEAIHGMLPSVAMGAPHLLPAVVLEGVCLLLERGAAPSIPTIMASYGIVLVAMGRASDAYNMGQLGAHYAERWPTHPAAAQGELQFCVFLLHHRDALREVLPRLLRCANRSLEVGDVTNFGYCVNQHLMHAVLACEDLGELDGSFAAIHAGLLHHRQTLAAAAASIFGELIAHLRGRGGPSTALVGERFDQATADMVRGSFLMGEFFLDGASAWLALLDGRFEDAARLAARSRTNRAGQSFFFNGPVEMWEAVAIAALGAEDARERIDALRELLAGRAELCPANHAHRLALVDAELARLDGQDAAAMAAYDRAAQLSSDGGWLGDLALTWERAAALHASQGRPQLARACLEQAAGAWRRWGATGQAARVEGALVTRRPYHLSTEELGATLDGQAVVRAALAIAGAPDLPRLLTRVMRTLMHAAGATHGSLLMDHGGRLTVAATARAVPEQVVVLDAVDEARAEVAWSVVRAVHRSSVPVVLADALTDDVFGGDPWLREHGVRSALCAPITHGARPVGVVYLENRLAPGTFTGARTDLVRVIATLAASLVDNARLLRDLEGTTAALRASHEQLRDHSRVLEHTVADRTRDLARLNHDLQIVLETVSEGILRLDEKGLVIWANLSAAEIAGRPLERLAGTRLRDLFSPEDPSSGASPDEVCSTQEEPVETLLDLPDGSTRVVERTCRPIHGDAQTPPGTVVTLRDVTERIQVAEQLRQAQKMEAVGRLAGGVAHEFNNLLTTLIGNLSLLQMGGPADRQDNQLRSAMQAGHRAADLVRHMLALGRRAEIHRSPLDVIALVDEVLNFLRPSLDRGIALVWEPPPVALWALGDAGQLHQVMLNLCINARDAVQQHRGEDPADAPLIEVTVAATGADALDAPPCLAPGAYVTLTVKDNGAGMDEATRARAFEPFFTTKDVGRGTGLGLSVVDGILSQHGGAITCDSSPLDGTTICCWVPAAEPARQTVVDAPSRQAPPGCGCILIVDDEAPVREAGRAMLEHLGHEVLEAASGREALEIYAAHRDAIAVVLLDLSMPEMSGERTLELLRANDPTVRVLVWTGYDLTSRQEQADALPADGYLSKPCTPAQLGEAVQAALRE